MERGEDEGPQCGGGESIFEADVSRRLVDQRAGLNVGARPANCRVARGCARSVQMTRASLTSNSAARRHPHLWPRSNTGDSRTTRDFDCATSPVNGPAATRLPKYRAAAIPVTALRCDRQTP